MAFSKYHFLAQILDRWGSERRKKKRLLLGGHLRSTYNWYVSYCQRLCTNSRIQHSGWAAIGIQTIAFWISVFTPSVVYLEVSSWGQCSLRNVLENNFFLTSKPGADPGAILYIWALEYSIANMIEKGYPRKPRLLRTRRYNRCCFGSQLSQLPRRL